MPDDPAPGPGRLGALWAVLERDFVVTTSRRRFLAMRLGVVVVSALVVGVVLGANLDRRPDTIGRYVLGAAAFVVPLLVFLIAPAGAAASITSEREGGTLDLVLAAPGNALTFVLAKFLSRFGALLVLVLGLLPVMGVAFVYGGVGMREFLEVLQLTVGFAVVGTAVGLLTSAWARSTPAAVLGAFLLLLAGPVVPGLAIGMTGAWLGVPDDTLESLLAGQPSVVWAAQFMRFFSPFGVPDLLDPHTAVLGAVSLVAFAGAVLRIAREGVVPARPGRRRRRASRGIFLDRPVLDRGVRGTLIWRPRKTAWVVPALGLAAIGFHVVAAADNHWRMDEAEFLIVLGILSILLGFQVLAAASASIAVERRSGALDVLLATPCSVRDVVRHRSVAAVLGTAPSLLLALGYGAVGVVAADLPVPALTAWALTTLLLLTFVAAVGVRVSATTRSPGVAAIRAFAVMAGLILGHGLLMFLLAVGGAGGDFAEVLSTWSAPVLVFLIPFSTAEAFQAEGSWRLFDTEVIVSSWLCLAAHTGGAAFLIARSRAALRRSMDGV